MNTKKKFIMFVSLLVLVMSMATVALAFSSGQNPGAIGPNTITWTGQGGGSDFQQLCDAANDPGGANQPYLLWILTTDGGSIQSDNTTPILHLGGSGSGNFFTDNPSDNSVSHFITPYFTPDSNLTAYADINVLTTGTGSWELTISHGCPGTTPATSKISTEVHLGATDSGAPVVVDDNNPANLGDTVHDSASLTTDPTPVTLPSGSYVVFSFWKNNTCNGTADDTSSNIDLSGQSSPVSVDPALAEGPLAAGKYSYSAAFTSGDENVVTSSSSACEPFKVNKGDTNSSTTVIREDTGAAVPLNGHLPLGTKVHDTASVGTQVDGFVIGGSVTYHWYMTIDCTGTPSAYPPANEDVTMSGGLVPDSSSHGPLGAGNYSFNADYSGDKNYNGSTSPCEPFIVDKGDVTLTTVIDDNATDQPIVNPVNLGTSVHDHATFGGGVTGFAINPPDATYKFYNTIDCTGTGADAGSGDTSSVEGPLGAGSYSFQASYLGNDNYNPKTSDCEPLTVKKGDTSTSTAIHLGATDSGTPIVVTGINLGQTVHDSAKVTGTPPAFALTGNVDFTWFTNGTCDGTGTSAGSVTLVNGVADPSNPETPTAIGMYAFRAHYPGDNNYKESTSDCEPLQVFRAPLTIGYWQNHLAPTGTAGCNKLPNGTGCSNNGPWTRDLLGKSICSGDNTCLVGNLGTGYTVTTFQQAAAVFAANNCSNASKSDSNAAACLAAQLLAAQLNVANGANPCICATITAARAALTAVGYAGPGSTITFSGSGYTRGQLIALKTALDNYNNGKGCP